MNWLDNNGYAGYDPYDVLGTRLFLYLQRLPSHVSPIQRLLRKLSFSLLRRYPLTTRKLLGVKKTLNAKGMGLLAKGYLSLFSVSGDERYRRKAEFCLDWLEHNISPGYSGPCWGYPFDWQSRIFIPRGTPSSVVSSIVGDAFWSSYRIFNRPRSLEICKGICRFLTQDLNRDPVGDNTLCFSYTPLDHFHVHNANLFTAEYLARIGRESGDPELFSLALQASRYALQEQNSDGSLFYWGRDQSDSGAGHIDHYHSGFEIRSLHRIYQLTKDEDYIRAVRRYFEFYLENLILWQGDQAIPKLNPHSIYPVNIHSCAEAILVNVTLFKDFQIAEELLPALLLWTIDRMQKEDGSYAYLLDLRRGREVRDEMPYIRWGQAWMLNALAQAIAIGELG